MEPRDLHFKKILHGDSNKYQVWKTFHVYLSASRVAGLHLNNLSTPGTETGHKAFAKNKTETDS